VFLRVFCVVVLSVCFKYACVPRVYLSLSVRESSAVSRVGEAREYLFFLFCAFERKVETSYVDL